MRTNMVKKVKSLEFSEEEPTDDEILEDDEVLINFLEWLEYDFELA